MLYIQYYILFGLIYFLLVLLSTRFDNTMPSISSWEFSEWSAAITMSVMWPITLIAITEYCWFNTDHIGTIGDFLTKERRLFK